MSHIAHPSTLLEPGLAAPLTHAMLAALPASGGAGLEQQAGHDTELIGQLDGLHARDLAEHMLAVQVVLDLQHTMACFRALSRMDDTSKEASQMRRDALAMQRGLAAMTRALLKAQSRRLGPDGEQLTGRPAKAAPPRTPQPEDGWLRERPDDPQPEAAADGGAAEPASAAPPVDRSQLPSPPFETLPRKLQALYNANPSLKRLRERWDTLPRWEDMTMQERRDTFGYTWTPPEEPPATSG